MTLGDRAGGLVEGPVGFPDPVPVEPSHPDYYRRYHAHWIRHWEIGSGAWDRPRSSTWLLWMGA